MTIDPAIIKDYEIKFSKLSRKKNFNNKIKFKNTNYQIHIKDTLTKNFINLDPTLFSPIQKHVEQILKDHSKEIQDLKRVTISKNGLSEKKIEPVESPQSRDIHRISGRIFYSAELDEETLEKIKKQPPKNLGMKNYNRFVGFFMWFFGKAICVKEDQKNLYLNKSDFLKFNAKRFQVLNSLEKLTPSEIVAKMEDTKDDLKHNKEVEKSLDRFILNHPSLSVEDLFEQGQRLEQESLAKTLKQETQKIFTADRTPWETAAETRRKAIDIFSAEAKRVEKKQLMEKMQKNQLHSNLNIKAAAHVLGDNFVGKSGLEGYQKKPIMVYVKTFLEKRVLTSPQYNQKHKEIIKKDCQVMARAIQLEFKKQLYPLPALGIITTFDYIVNEVIADLKALAPEQSYILPSGWAGSPGHAMYIKVTKYEDGTYGVKTFNTGEGLQFHPTESDPCYELVNITPEKMLNPLIFRALFEMDSYSSYWNFENSKNQAKHIYKDILPLLDGDVKLHPPREFFPQINGICSYAGLLAMVQEYMPVDVAHKITIEMEFQFLNDLFCDHPDVNKLDEETRLLMKLGSEKLARHLENHQLLFSLEEQKHMQQVLALIQSHLEESVKADHHQKAQLQKAFECESLQKKSIGSLDPIRTLSTKSLKDAYSISEIVKYDLQLDKNTIEVQLKETKQKFKKLIDLRKYDEAVYSINEFFFQLPVLTEEGKDFWKSLEGDLKKIHHCMEEINGISEILFYAIPYSSVERLPLLHADNIMSMYKGLALQHQLTSLSPEIGEHVKTWNICTHEIAKLRSGYMPIKLYLKGLGSFYCGDRNIYENRRRQEFLALLEYFKSKQPDPFQAANESIFDYHDNYEMIETDKPLSGIENLFINQYIQRNKWHFLKAFPHFLLKLNKVYQCVSKAKTDLTGRFLPKEFCLLKRQALFANYTFKGQVKPQIKLALNDDVNSSINLIIIQNPTIKNYNPNLHLFPQGWYANVFASDPIENPLKNSLDSLKSFNVVQHLNQGNRLYALKPNDQVPKHILQEMVSLDVVDSYNEFSHFPNELQITKTLSYFSTHLELLCKRNYQIYFKNLLFQNDYLATLISKNPDIVKQMAAFILHTHHTYLSEKNIHGASFITNIKNLFEQELNGNYKKCLDPDAKRILKKTLDKLKNKQNRNSNLLEQQLHHSTTSEEKNLVWRQFIAQPYSKKTISDEEISHFLRGMVYLNMHSLDKKLCDHQLNYEMEQVRLKFSEEIKKHILNSENMAHTASLIIEDQFGKFPKQITWSCENYPLVKGKIEGEEPFMINFANYNVFRGLKKMAFLPPSVYEQGAFKQFFDNPHVEVNHPQPNVYEFSDSLGNPSRIIHQPERLIIQKMIKGKWYQNITSELIEIEQYNIALKKEDDKALLKQHLTSLNLIDFRVQAKRSIIKIFKDLEFVSPLKCRQLLENKSHWLTCEGEKEILIFDQQHKNSEPSFTVKVNKGFPSWGIDSITNNHQLRLSNIYSKKRKPYDLIKDFEELDQILVWEKEDGVQTSIEMPRLELDFKVEGQKAFSNQYPGYYIAPQQKVKKLNTYKHYLLLENELEDGKIHRKILIPSRPLKEAKPGSLTSEVGMSEDVNTNLQPYFEYDLDENNDLQAKGPASNLFLSYIYFLIRNYDKAQQHIRNGEKVKEYSEMEEHLFKLIFEISEELKDTCPKAQICSLTAKAVYLKNKKSFNNAKDEGTLEVSDLPDYPFLLKHVGSLKLTVEEEEILSLHNRKNKEKVIKKEEQNVLLSLDKITTQMLARKILFPPSYDKLPQLLIHTSSINFEYYYKRAKDPKQNRIAVLSELKLRCINPDLKEDELTYLHVLIAVAEKPDLFPSFKDLFLIAKEIGPANKYAINENYQNCKDGPFKDFVEIYNSVILELIKPQKILPAEELDEELVQLPIAPKDPEKDVLLTTQLGFSPLQSFLGNGTFNFKSMFESTESQTLLTQQEEQELTDSISTLNDHSSLERRKIKQLVKDLQSFNQTSNQTIYRLKKAKNKDDLALQLNQLTGTLNVQKGEMNKLLLKLEMDILTLANKKSSKDEEVIHQELEHLGTNKEAITVDSLSIIFLQDNFDKLLEINPALTMNDVKSLKKMVETYYLQATHRQAAERVLHSMLILENHIEKNKEMSIEDLMKDHQFMDLSNSIGQQLNSQRAYEQLDSLPYSLFEFHSNIRLRQDQIENIELLLSKNQQSGNLRDIILQMIMGSGKSKALLPILALKQADSDRLPIIVVPESLYETNASDLQNSLSKNFKQKIHPLLIDRETDLSEDSLKKLLEHLEKIRKNCECIISTNKSLQCLYLKYRELLLSYHLNGKDDESLTNQVKLFTAVLHLIKTKGHAIVDEADLILNSKFKVLFPTGTAEPLHSTRLNIASQLFDILINNEYMRKNLNLDFNSLSDPHAPPFNNEFYHQQIKPLLAKEFIQATMEKDNPLSNYLNSINDESRFMILSYLLEDKIDAEQVVMALEDPTLKDMLANAKEQLNKLLPLTLSKRAHVHYGRSGQASNILAIPYRGNNTPVETSQFGNPYELLNYTFQIYLKEGYPHSMIRQHLERLQHKARLERTDDSTLNFIDTAAFQELLSFYNDMDVDPVHLLIKFTEEDVVKIADQLNKTRDETFFNYLTKYVATEITTHPEVLSSNAYEFTDLFNSIQGFTGTPWNAETFSNKFEICKAKGVDGKTLALLYKNSRETIQELKTSNFQDILKTIVNEQTLSAGLRAHIDLGSLFSGIQNNRVADEMLKLITAIPNHSVKGIVYFNDNNEIMVLEQGKQEPVPFIECHLKPEERFTYYDQRHTTGTDIKQMDHGQAFVSIGKDTTLRDLFQAVWRMRGLAHLQKVSLLLSLESQNTIRKALSLDEEHQISLNDIIHFVYQNELRQLQEQLIDSTKQKVKHLVNAFIHHKTIHDITSKGPDTEKFQQFLGSVKETFITVFKDLPFATYGLKDHLIPTEQLFNHIQTQALKAIEGIPTNSEEDEAEKRLIIERMKVEMENVVNPKHLPKMLPSQLGKGASSEIEVEKEQEKEMELENEKEIYREDAFSSKFIRWDSQVYKKMFLTNFYIPLNANEFNDIMYPPIITIQKVIDSKQEFENFKGIFDEELLATYNFLKYKESSVVPKALPLFSQQQLPHQHYLVIRDIKTDSLKLMMLDNNGDVGYLFNYLTDARKDRYFHEEEAHMIEAMKEIAKAKNEVELEREVELYLFDSRFGLIQHSERGKDKDHLNNELMVRPDFIRLATQAKFYRGELSYTPVEKEVMKAWINEKGAKKMEELFETHILKWNPKEMDQFKFSALKRMFAELSAK